ncbi:hypothetical protein AB3A93_002469 [Vibrio parahaemolyticus]|uniref:Uncharacterized protein n=2 Tax=Vibrio parahaemolyticus TaxID=670 RepID=A0A8H9NAT3_VIBPH|nr:hypothetical protein [Vibrio parahaemolyticus]EJG0920382.1 hypothetical protein [Vibrio parahaemolyticus O1:K68]EJG0929997.1 hypothetical protein [Vibrio parahaemolyticus O1]EJG0944209.1 hypothetical protein [Vibrio parahaemolyticus O10]EQM46895.1 hypothetical protein D051_3647 [Vibrio parahaemolyticus VPCR-2010]AWA89260.1 hypothetical protein BSG32_09415 [Vibrio parahaemolyticus]
MNLHQLLALLLAGGNQNQFSNEQQNPLIALLSGNQQQDPTQQLIALLSGATGQQQNAINPKLLQLLSGGQQPNDANAQLLQLLAGGKPQQPKDDASELLLQLLTGGQQQQPNATPDVNKLLELLGGKPTAGNEDDDILAKLQQRLEKQNEEENTEADLTDAIKFNLEFDKFMEDNSEMFPDWFDIKEVKEDVEKWAKTPAERAQGLAAATVRAFFKNEKMLDLLEERDRNTVKEKIIKDGIKSHEIDRKLAWPLIERSMFNKGKLEEGGREVSVTKDSEAMKDYGSIFEMGQQANNAESA